jgi:hypothetical protein
MAAEIKPQVNPPLPEVGGPQKREGTKIVLDMVQL